jgi:hypothetical protein
MSRADDGGRSCRNGSAPTHLYRGRSAWRSEPWALNGFIAAQVWHIVSFQPELNPKSRNQPMTRFYQPDLSTDLDSPFIRDGEDKLIRRSYWLDMDDRTLVMVMVNGIGANLTNDEKRAHLIDLRREHLIDKVCIQEILPPEK